MKILLPIFKEQHHKVMLWLMGEEAKVITDTNNMSASSSKIDLAVYEVENIEDVQDMNFILNIKILNNIVDLLGKCPECMMQGKIITASVNL